ncbi:hypothetical protein BV921_16610 [Pectobacterium odoriferum]|nr:hypothetical protein BV921_16610 [Pectobacterium odoriferum]POE15974.1 hypothetical protein BV918_20035 [Pectobacterium odoriferum]POE31378.1 hypothetical protein BV922_19570 [Pectobacterium odoriferum]
MVSINTAQHHQLTRFHYVESRYVNNAPPQTGGASPALYPSYFKQPVHWLPLLPPVTYLCKLLGINEPHK